MNFKHCKDCPHRSYDGHTDRCRLLIADVMTGKRKACSQVRSEECRKARADFAAGLYKTIDDDGFQSDAAEIIAKAQARYAAERKAKEEKKTCGTCKHYPVNPIRNPARMEACGIYKIAVREGGKACPDFEDRGCKWRKLSAVNFALAQCPAYICTHPGIAKPAYCEEGDIPADCPAKEEKA